MNLPPESIGQGTVGSAENPARCPDCGQPCNRFTPPGDICECTPDCKYNAC